MRGAAEPSATRRLACTGYHGRRGGRACGRAQWVMLRCSCTSQPLRHQHQHRPLAGLLYLRHLFSADELATARPVAGGEADWGERSKRRTVGIAARWRLVKLGLPDRAHSTRLLIVSDQWDGVQQKQTQTSVASARLGRWLSFTCVVAICPAGSVCCWTGPTMREMGRKSFGSRATCISS